MCLTLFQHPAIERLNLKGNEMAEDLSLPGFPLPSAFGSTLSRLIATNQSITHLELPAMLEGDWPGVLAGMKTNNRIVRLQADQMMTGDARQQLDEYLRRNRIPLIAGAMRGIQWNSGRHAFGTLPPEIARYIGLLAVEEDDDATVTLNQVTKYRGEEK